jgi:hypothetical protein
MRIDAAQHSRFSHEWHPGGGQIFRTVPYPFHMNDISSFALEGYNRRGHEEALRDEFDQLYEEGANRRRLMLMR